MELRCICLARHREFSIAKHPTTPPVSYVITRRNWVETMASTSVDSVKEGTWYVLDQLLAVDGLRFSHQYNDDASLTRVKVAQLDTVPIYPWREEPAIVFQSQGK